MNNKEVSKEKPNTPTFWPYVKKNGLTIVMAVLLVVLLISPDAKSFALRQLMATGLFNASLDTKDPAEATASDVDFRFVDENGDVHSTASLRGQVVFINFWASWCPPCRAEFPSIETLYTTFKDDPDVFFLMINQDSDQAAGKAYLRNEGFSVPFYTLNGPVSEELYSGALPTTVVLDKNGKIRFHHAGFANYASDKFVKQIEGLMAE